MFYIRPTYELTKEKHINSYSLQTEGNEGDNTRNPLGYQIILETFKWARPPYIMIDEKRKKAKVMNFPGQENDADVVQPIDVIDFLQCESIDESDDLEGYFHSDKDFKA